MEQQKSGRSWAELNLCIVKLSVDVFQVVPGMIFSQHQPAIGQIWNLEEIQSRIIELDA